MVMNRFKVFSLDHVAFYALIVIEATSDVPHHVFDKLWIIVRSFGHELFVRPLQEAI